MDTENLKPWRLTLIEFAIVVAVVAMLLIFAIPKLRQGKSISYQMACGTNMGGIAKAIVLYAEDNNDTFPTSGKWCDLLIAHTDISAKQFRCPADKVGPCSYAMNPNCNPDSLPDTVLLFECRPGWNQYGGPELLMTRAHRHPGCNVAFVDSSAVWVKQEDIPKLNWGTEPNEQ